MGRIRILQTGDVHLGKDFKRFGLKAADRQTELLKSFRRQVDFALHEDNAIDIFLITGDLFDTYKPKPNLVGEVKALLKRLADNKVISIIIPGTHDSYGHKDSVWKQTDFAPSAFVFTSQQPSEPLHLSINDENLFFYGFAYDPINSRDPMSHVKRIDADGIHIGVFHCSIVDRSDIQIRKKDLPVSSDKLASYGFDYCALGHHHDCKEIRDRFGNLVAMYAGSPEATRLHELGERKFLVINFQDRVLDIQSHPSNLRTVRKYTVDTTGLQSLDDVFEACVHCCDDKQSIVSFDLVGVPEFIIDSDSLTKMLSAQFYFSDLLDHTNVLTSNFVTQIGQERATIRKLFLEELSTRLNESKSEQERETLQLALKIGLDEFLRNSRA